MKLVIANFNKFSFSAEISLLPPEAGLEVLKNAELVVRSELDLFKAKLRFGVCSSVNDTRTDLNAQIVTRTQELLVQLNELPDGYIISEPESCKIQIHSGLFDFVDISNMSNVDLRLVLRFCRQLCAEAQSNHDLDLVYLREFGENALEKLLEGSNL